MLLFFGVCSRKQFFGLLLLCVLVTLSCLTLQDPMDCSSPGSSVLRDSPGKNTVVGCHFLLQEIFPTQGLNPGLPYCRQLLYHLSQQGKCFNVYNDSHKCGHMIPSLLQILPSYFSFPPASYRQRKQYRVSQADGETERLHG